MASKSVCRANLCQSQELDGIIFVTEDEECHVALVQNKI